jgi:hypothetical protein
VTDRRSLIENTLNKYAFCYDVGPLEPIADCFAVDAEVTFVDTGPFFGRDAVAQEMARRRQVPRYQDGSTPWHVISNIYIVDGDEFEVTVRTWWTFFVIGPDKTPRLDSVGYYDDVLRNDGDTWRIKHRIEREIGRVRSLELGPS